MAVRALQRRVTRLLLAILISACLKRGFGESKATVRVEAITAADQLLQNPNARLLDPGTSKEVAAFHDSVATGVPYGEFILRLREPGFKWYEQKIKIDQPNVVVRVRIAIAEIRDGP